MLNSEAEFGKEKISSRRTPEMRARIIEIFDLPPDTSWVEIDRDIAEDDIRMGCALDISLDEIKEQLAERRAREIAERERHHHDSAEGVVAFENELNKWLNPEILEPLLGIRTEEEALASVEREKAMNAHDTLSETLKELRKNTNLTDEQLIVLQKKLKVLSQAVGLINRGSIDHSR